MKVTRTKIKNYAKTSGLVGIPLALVLMIYLSSISAITIIDNTPDIVCGKWCNINVTFKANKDIQVEPLGVELIEFSDISKIKSVKTYLDKKEFDFKKDKLILKKNKIYVMEFEIEKVPSATVKWSWYNGLLDPTLVGVSNYTLSFSPNVSAVVFADNRTRENQTVTGVLATNSSSSYGTYNLTANYSSNFLFYMWLNQTQSSAVIGSCLQQNASGATAGDGSCALNYSGTQSSSSSTSLSYCYQEQTNESKSGDGSCSLSYTGGYTGANNWSDADWSTYYTGSTQGIINYTKPSGATNATWNVGDQGGNFTLQPTFACWNASTTNLYFKLLPNQLRWYCIYDTEYMDGTSLRLNSTVPKQAYEEGVNWTISTTIASGNQTFIKPLGAVNATYSIAGVDYAVPNSCFWRIVRRTQIELRNTEGNISCKSNNAWVSMSTNATGGLGNITWNIHQGMEIRANKENNYTSSVLLTNSSQNIFNITSGNQSYIWLWADFYLPNSYFTPYYNYSLYEE